MFKENIQRTGASQYSGLHMLNGIKWQFKHEFKLANRNKNIVFERGYLYCILFLDASTTSEFCCIEAATGSLIWSIELYESVHKFSARFSSLVVSDDLAYFTFDWAPPPQKNQLKLYAIDLNKQEIKYLIDVASDFKIYSDAPQYLSSERKTFDYLYTQMADSSLLIVDDNLYIGTKNGYICCLEPESRTLKWKILVCEGAAISHFAYADGHLCVESLNGNLYCIDTESCSTKWVFGEESESPLNTHASSCPAISDGKVYTCKGRKSLYSIDLASGDILWEYRIDSKTTAGDCIVHQGIVCLTMAGRQFHAVSAKSGEKLWVYDAGITSTIPPLVAAGDLLYIACCGHLRALNLLTGEKIWQWEVPPNPQKLSDMKYLFRQFSNQITKLFFDKPLFSSIPTLTITNGAIFLIAQEDTDSTLIALN
ncbi:MAG: PQQ-binding-like beta-propeller repeat protein [Cyanobacteria bacterium P01_D01_bin.6]